MESEQEERRFSVKWYLHITHPRGGTVRGRTFFVSRSGLVFLSPIRFRTGETLDIDVFIQPTVPIRCKVRIVGDGTPHQADFIQFPGGGQKVWNDTLLDLHRARVNRR